jgi:ribonuclease I
MYNHEWEKHGNCFSPGQPYEYFKAALKLDEMLRRQMQNVNALGGSTVNKTQLESFFSKSTQIICDPLDTPWNA